MKDNIRSAQMVLSCADLNRTLEFFVETLGFRVESIFPADAPAVAVISGYGTTLRLEEARANSQAPFTLRLFGDFAEDAEREIFSPDGARVSFSAAETPLEIPASRQEFVLATLEDENSWNEGRASMLYRDLIPGRLGGGFVASHIRIPQGGAVPDYVHYHKIRFQMIYCLSGWVRVVYEDQGEPFLLQAGDCVLQPPEIRHRVLESSENLEVIEIGSPAMHETRADHELELPNAKRAPARIFGGQTFVRHIAENAVWEKSAIEGIETRDTEIGTATGGLADVRVLRAAVDARFPAENAGEFLFFFVLGGNVRLSDAAGKIHRLTKGGSFVLPFGARYFIEAERGSEMLRVSLPAEDRRRKN